MYVPLAPAVLMSALLTTVVGPQPTMGFPSAQFVRDIAREAGGSSSAAHGAIGAIHYSAHSKIPRNSDTPTDFWKRALSLGKHMQTYASFLFRNATEGAEPAAAAQIKYVSDTVHGLVTYSEKLKTSIEHVRGAAFDDIQLSISQNFTELLQELHEQLPLSVQSLTRAERVGNVSMVVQKVEATFVSLSIQHGVSEKQLKSHLDAILEHAKEVAVTLGDVAEQHPELFETLAIAGAMLIIPESWFLRPLFMVFGMSPEGPVEGSIVAWAQGRFFGAYIPEGSWFSQLQRAGMTVGRRSLPKTIVKIIGWAVVGLFGLGVAIFLAM